MINEQELNKKLAEWAGFTYRDTPHGNCWTDPDGMPHFDPLSRTASFPQSLDSCFKWLVPLAINELTKIGHFAPATMKLFQLWYDELVTLAGDSSNTKRAALALCLAIEKLIDNEKGGDNDIQRRIDEARQKLGNKL